MVEEIKNDMPSLPNKEKPELILALLSSLSHDLKEPIRSIRTRILLLTSRLEMNKENSNQLEELKKLVELIIEIGQTARDFKQKSSNSNFNVIVQFIIEVLNPKIKNYLEVIDQLFKDKAFNHYTKELEQIHFQSRRLKRIVDGIKDFADTKGKLNKSSFGFHNEIDRIKIDLADVIKEKEVKINCYGRVIFYGDQIKIVQLFQNLLLNSIYYCNDKQNPIIDIEIKHLKNNELSMDMKKHLTKTNLNIDFVYTTVKDNGIGIEQDDIDKVFNINFRSDRLNKRNDSTGGLGLAIVKSVAEAHEGTVWIESEIEIGTTVHILLPNLK